MAEGVRVMKTMATFPRIGTLVLAVTVGLATLSFAAGAAESNNVKPTQPIAAVSSLNKTANNTYNPIETAVANYMAKKQAEEAAKAAEAAAQQAAAANQQAAAANSGGGGSGATATAGGSDDGDIYSILASFGVPGTSIGYGDAHGYEACAYYKSGYIVIDPNHTTDLYTLIAHEINHILAWRESGQTTE